MKAHRSQAGDTREAILDAAKALLRRHGGNKLIVVDIARSLGMSHANVYRYFKSKSEILDAIVQEWMSKLAAFVEAIAQRPAPASVRLEALVLELYRLRNETCLKDPEIYVTYRRIMDLRPGAAVQRQETLRKVVKRLIEEGITAGEFASVDSLEAATLIEDATALFLHPLMIPSSVGGRAEERASNVIRHLIRGFRSSALKR